VTAVTAIGTSWRIWARPCAVMTISPPVSGSLACAWFVGWVCSWAWAGAVSAMIPAEINQKDFVIQPSPCFSFEVELMKSQGVGQ